MASICSQQTHDPKYKAALERDIAELDQMIDEILLTSRLGAVQKPQMEESIDLLALAAEEGARYDDCAVEGEALTVRGERRLLARLIRNLLDNAEPPWNAAVRVVVRGDGGRAILEVADSGAGVPEAERERVFSPFHRLAGDAQGHGARARAGPADRAAARRRRDRRAAARPSELLPGQHAASASAESLAPRA